MPRVQTLSEENFLRIVSGVKVGECAVVHEMSCEEIVDGIF